MTRLPMAIAVLLCASTPCLAAEEQPPVDEDRIYEEMAELQDRTGTIKPKAQQRAAELVREGVKAHDRHDYDEAIRLYRRALSENPISVKAYYELALALHAKGELVAALENTIRSIALNPNQEESYVMQGSVEDDLGHPEKALATYDRLLGVAPTSYLGLLNKAITLMKLSRYEEAETILHQARESHPDEPPTYLRLAHLARAQGFNYDEQKYLERFLELGARDPRSAAAKARLEELRQQNLELSADAAHPDIELAILAERALWKAQKHRELYPEARGYSLTFEEERAVLQELALGLWRKKKMENPAAQDDHLDFLLKIDDAGFFEEYVYHQRQREIGQAARDWLAQHPERVDVFLAWAKVEGLTEENPSGDTDAAATDSSLPGLVLAALDKSKVVYEISATNPDTPEFFDRERERWKRFRLDGDGQVDCNFEIRVAVDNAYGNHLRFFQDWVRCFGPEDEDWDEVKLAQRFGYVYRDLAPRLQGRIEVDKEGKVLVEVSPTAGWMMYILSKAAWPREAELREAFENGRGPEVSLSEEIFAFRVAVQAYRNSRVPDEGEEPAAPDSYMEQLARIEERGLLRPFVAFEVLHKRYGISLRRIEQNLAEEIDRYLVEFTFQRTGEGTTAAEKD